MSTDRWIGIGAVVLVAVVAVNGHLPGVPDGNTSSPPPAVTQQQTNDQDCQVSIQADDGNATPADRDRTMQMARRVCAALDRAEHDPGAASQPPPPTPQDVAETRQACDDLHRQGFMRDVDCATLNPPHPYYHH